MKKTLLILATALAPLFAQDISWYNANSNTLEISTGEQLKGLAQLVNNNEDLFIGKTIKLANNIVLTGNFTPIGNGSRNFQGTFDGQGYTISGLSVGSISNISVISYAGLFGYVGAYGQIKNINVIGGEIIGRTAGGLVGYYASEKPIENSSVRANVITIGNYSGGLVGYASAALTIANSYTNGKVSAIAICVDLALGLCPARTYSGGLVGYANEALTITDSYASGGVSAEPNTFNGIRYYPASHLSGGLVGYANGITNISNSHVRGNISSVVSYNGSVLSSGTGSGGLVGNGSATLTITDSYLEGDVSGSTSGGLVGNGSTINIANSYANGDISCSSYCGGLVANGGIINIANSYANGDVSGSTSGGLVGGASAALTISDSYATGDVSATTSCSGGLVGSLSLSASLSPKSISNSYANGNISATGTEAYSGGLIGCTSGNSLTITESYASGNVFGARSGGLVGNSSSALTITDSYASGNISAELISDYSGGLVGYGHADITNSYASGSTRGGIFGRYSSGTMTSVYYNSNEASRAAGTGSPTGILGLPSTNLKNQLSFAGWNFNEIWGISSTINNSYPYLRRVPIRIEKSSSSSVSSSSSSSLPSSSSTTQISSSSSSSIFYSSSSTILSSSSSGNYEGNINGECKDGSGRQYYCQWEEGCHAIDNIYSNIGVPCPDLVSLCQNYGTLFINVNPSALHEGNEWGKGISCSNVGGTQVSTPNSSSSSAGGGAVLNSFSRIATGNLTAKAIDKTIMLENMPQGAKVQIYNLRGERIYSTNLENPKILKIGVQTGVYIVKVNSQTLRMVVK